MIAKNEKRKEIAARYDERRKKLKAQLIDPEATDEEREEARVGLQKLPRDASPVRIRNRQWSHGYGYELAKRPVAASAGQRARLRALRTLPLCRSAVLAAPDA